MIEAPENLSEDEVADGEWHLAEQPVDSDARTDENQLSVLIAFRSHCQSSLPRKPRIFFLPLEAQ